MIRVLAPKDGEKTASCVSGKQYGFSRMPFELWNAPATIRRFLLQVLENLDDVLGYGDDIVIFSKTIDEHVSRLTAVLKRIKMVGLKLSTEKCQIARDRILCLEHVGGGGEITTLPEERDNTKSPIPEIKASTAIFSGPGGIRRQICGKSLRMRPKNHSN